MDPNNPSWGFHDHLGSDIDDENESTSHRDDGLQDRNQGNGALDSDRKDNNSTPPGHKLGIAPTSLFVGEDATLESHSLDSAAERATIGEQGEPNTGKQLSYDDFPDRKSTRLNSSHWE